MSLYTVRSLLPRYRLVARFAGILSAYLERHRWLETIIFQILEGITYLVILWNFRLRDFPRATGEDTSTNGSLRDEPDNYTMVQTPGRLFLAVTLSARRFDQYMRSLLDEHHVL